MSLSWNEIRVSANITSYLGGYDDPRLSAYVNDAQLDGAGRAGVRNGIYQSDATRICNFLPSQYRRKLTNH